MCGIRQNVSGTAINFCYISRGIITDYSLSPSCGDGGFSCGMPLDTLASELRSVNLRTGQVYLIVKAKVTIIMIANTVIADKPQWSIVKPIAHIADLEEQNMTIDDYEPT